MVQIIAKNINFQIVPNGIFMVFQYHFHQGKKRLKIFRVCCFATQAAAWLFCKWWFLCVTFEINNHSSMSDKKLLLALLGKRGSDGLWTMGQVEGCLWEFWFRTGLFSTLARLLFRSKQLLLWKLPCNRFFVNRGKIEIRPDKTLDRANLYHKAPKPFRLKTGLITHHATFLILDKKPLN